MNADRRCFFNLTETISELIERLAGEINTLAEEMGKLRDDFHAEKEKIRSQRARFNEPKYNTSSGDKKMWSSRVVIRLKTRPVTTSKKLPQGADIEYALIQFYRQMGGKRKEHIRKLKCGAYSEKTILLDGKNNIPNEEENTIRYFIGEVNFYNQKMTVLKELLLNALKAKQEMQKVV